MPSNPRGRSFKIEGRLIGPGQPVFVIAEAGVNHNGDLALAKKLVLEAKKAGADCVKFQTFKAEQLVVPSAPKAAYQLKSTDPSESQFDMLKKLELPATAYPELIALCKKEKIIFMSTPYNSEDVDFLDRLGVTSFKLASIHLVEPYLLKYTARKGKPIILSTGMSSMAEVRAAVRALRQVPGARFVLLQCTTNYPSPIEDAHLRAMTTMRDELGALVGYSDHTQSLTSSTVAVGLGATVIERHFTLDKKMPGPDHACSSDPGEFAQLVRQIREAERALGTTVKSPTASEKRNAVGMRRSIVARRAIAKGTRLRADDLAFKRPSTGLKPSVAEKLIGRTVRADIQADQMIRPEHLR